MTRVVRYQEYAERVAERKFALGLDDAYLAAALRNPGDLRTPEKREFLAQIDARVVAAGGTPVPSNY